MWHWIPFRPQASRAAVSSSWKRQGSQRLLSTVVRSLKSRFRGFSVKGAGSILHLSMGVISLTGCFSIWSIWDGWFGQEASWWPMTVKQHQSHVPYRSA